MKSANLRILLVEDNAADAELLRERIADSGLVHVNLEHCTTLGEACARLIERAYDVVMLDLGLPDSRGVDGLAELERIAPRVPVIVVTGSEDDEQALLALQRGAQDFLRKDDLTADTLARSARYALQRKRSMSQRTELLQAIAQELRKPTDELVEAADLACKAGGLDALQSEALARVVRGVELIRGVRAAIAERATVVPAAGSGASELESIVTAIRRGAGGDEIEAAMTPASWMSRCRILLVEDNPGDALLVEESVAEVDHVAVDLTVSTSLSDAIDRLTRGSFEAVLLDLGLPDTTGLEAVAEVERVAPALPVVVLTGNSDDGFASRALAMGAQDYLVKGEAKGISIVRSVRYAIERQRAVNLVAEWLEAVARELARPLHNVLGGTHLLFGIVPGKLDDPQAAALSRMVQSAMRLQVRCEAMLSVAHEARRFAGDDGIELLFEALQAEVARRNVVADEAQAESLASLRTRAGGATTAAAKPGLLARMLSRIAPSRRRVLLVDRDEDSRAIARHTLESANFDVIEAGHDHDGLEALRENTVDLAVLEEAVNVLSFPARVRSLQEAAEVCGAPSLLVGALTPRGNGASAVGDAAPTLAKPFTPEQLLFAVDWALAGRGAERRAS